jgi:23S rRNA-/tRNA-specific pseudouridylate synthase
MMTVKKILINEDNEGRRIDNFLISIFSTVPKSKIYNIIRKDGVIGEVTKGFLRAGAKALVVLVGYLSGTALSVSLFLE